MDGNFELLSFEQYLSAGSSIDYVEYTRKHIFYSLKEILNTRTEYLKSLSIKETISKQIDESVSKYFQFFHSITSSFAEPISAEQSDMVGKFPEKNENILNYLLEVVDVMSKQPKYVSKVYIDPVFDDFAVITPSNIDEEVVFAYAQFCTGSHLVAGLNKCIDSLYKLVQLDQNKETSVNTKISYTQKSFDGYANIESVTVDAKKVEFATQKIAMQIFDIATQIIADKSYNMIEYAEEQLEICVRILQKCENLVNIQKVVILATLRCVCVYLHVYSYRTLQSPANKELLLRLINMLIFASNFMEDKAIKESFCLIMALVPRDIYSKEYCEAVIRKIEGEERKFMVGTTAVNPQLIYSVIYSDKNVTEADVLPLIDIIPFMNNIFNIDEALVPFITHVFNIFDENPNFPLIKTLIEQISCIKKAPHVAVAFVEEVYNKLDKILKILETEKVFSGYLMMILSSFIDAAIESNDTTQIDQNIKTFAELLLRNKERSQKIPNSVENIFNNNLSEELSYAINYLSISIPFIQRKAPAKEILDLEMKCLATMLFGADLVNDFTDFAGNLFKNQEKAIPKNSSKIPQQIKVIWRNVYAVRRLLMNSFQYVTAESKSSELKVNFSDLSNDIDEKCRFILESANLKLVSQTAEEKIQEIYKFITCTHRMDEIRNVLTVMDDMTELTVKALSFIPKVCPRILTDDEFYLLANLKNDFHKNGASSNETGQKLVKAIKDLEDFMFKRTSEVSHECVAAYSMHTAAPFSVLLHTIKTCKNEIIQNCAWYSIYRNTLMNKESEYINGLIDLGRDFTIERHQLLSLSILQRLDIAPVEIQKLMEKFSKYKDEPLYIFLSSTAANHDDSDLAPIPRLIPVMLANIGDFVTGGNGMLTVIEEMINFIRYHMQKDKRASSMILPILHDALSKLSRNMPQETIGVLVVLGFGGLPPQTSRFYKDGKEYSLLMKPLKSVASARIKPQFFDLTKNEADLFEQTLNNIVQYMGSGAALSPMTTIIFEIFFASLPVFLENPANSQVFSPSFIESLEKIAFRDAEQVEPVVDLLDYFGWLSNNLQYQNFSLFHKPGKDFIAIGVMPDTKNSVIWMYYRPVSNTETLEFAVKFSNPNENVFVGFTPAHSLSSNIKCTGIYTVPNVNGFNYNIADSTIMINRNSFEFKYDVIPIIICENSLTFTPTAYNGANYAAPVENIEFSTPLIGCHIISQGMPSVVTERSTQRICAHFGNRRIVQVKQRYLSMISEPLSIILHRLKPKSSKNTSKKHQRKLELLAILLSRLSICSAWKNNIYNGNKIEFIWRFISSFFKFNLALNQFVPIEYSELTIYNMKSYKSFVVEKLSESQIFEKVCKFGLNLLNNSTEEYEEISINAEAETPPNTAVLFPPKREFFDKDYYPPGKVTLEEHNNIPLMLVREFAVEKADSKTYNTTNLLKLYKFAGPGLLGIYCRTVYPNIKNNYMYNTIIFEKVKENKKLMFSSARVLCPAPTRIEEIIAVSLLSNIQLITIWAKIKSIMFEDALIDFEKNFKDRPDPLNETLFGSSQFSSLIDAFVIQASVSDKSIGIPRYPLYLYAKMWTQVKLTSHEINCSKTFKDLSPGAELTLYKYSGPGEIEVVFGQNKVKMTQGQTIKITTSMARVNMIGTKGQVATFQISDMTKPGTYLPLNFRSLIQKAEKYYSFMNDLVLADVVRKERPSPIFPGIDPLITQIRAKFLGNIVLISSKYNFGFPFSVSKGQEEIISYFKQQLLTHLINTHGNDKYRHVTFDRMSAYFAYSGGRGQTLFRQFAKQMWHTNSKIGKIAFFTTDWHIDLRGEGAIDAGGPRREAFDELCNEIIEHDFIFEESPNSKELGEGIKIPKYGANYNDLKLAGAVMAASVNLNAAQPFKLEPFIWRCLCGEPLKIEDMLEIDDELKSTVNAIKNGYNGKIAQKSINGDVIFNYTFTDNISAAQRENIANHILNTRLNEMIKTLEPFLIGFHKIIPENLCKTVPPSILEAIVCKERDLKTEQFVDHCTIHGKQEYRKMFVEALNMMTSEQRVKLLKFSTGSTSLPKNKKIDVRIIWREDDEEMGMKNAPLPHAGTCFMSLVMPAYQDANVMASKIITAIEYSSIITDTDIDAALFNEESDQPTYINPSNRH